MRGIHKTKKRRNIKINIVNIRKKRINIKTNGRGDVQYNRSKGKNRERSTWDKLKIRNAI